MDLKSSILILALVVLSAGPAAGQTCPVDLDMDCSGGQNLWDVFLITSLFDGTGAVPDCIYAMDMNGDCVVDWADYWIALDCATAIDLHCPVIQTCCNPEVRFTCCSGVRGDANGDGTFKPTISDLSAMIDAKFLAGYCEGIIDCPLEADLNLSGGHNPTCADITVGDITWLIDYLFISQSWDSYCSPPGPPCDPPYCPGVGPGE